MQIQNKQYWEFWGQKVNKENNGNGEKGNNLDYIGQKCGKSLNPVFVPSTFYRG